MTAAPRACRSCELHVRATTPNILSYNNYGYNNMDFFEDNLEVGCVFEGDFETEGDLELKEPFQNPSKRQKQVPYKDVDKGGLGGLKPPQFFCMH